VADPGLLIVSERDALLLCRRQGALDLGKIESGLLEDAGQKPELGRIAPAVTGTEPVNPRRRDQARENVQAVSESTPVRFLVFGGALW
jgi:hypothetical protein